MKKIICLVALCISFGATSQTVNTIADGEPNDGMVVDSDNNLYCSDFSAGIF